jgi:hypothetical protein
MPMPVRPNGQHRDLCLTNAMILATLSGMVPATPDHSFITAAI